MPSLVITVQLLADSDSKQLFTTVWLLLSRLTRLTFLKRDTMIARYLLSSCVSPSGCHKPVLYRNNWTNRAGFFARRLLPTVYTVSWSGSVVEWLACWTQAQYGPGSSRSRDVVG